MNLLQKIKLKFQGKLKVYKIKKSKYFDEYWYKNHYNLQKEKNAAYHYLREGWIKGYNPSLKFSTKEYQKNNPNVDICPLLDYEMFKKENNRKIVLANPIYNGNYKEYFVRVDSVCNVLTFRKVDNYKELEDLKSKRSLTRRDRKRLKSLQENLQTINNAFDMSQYSNELMTFRTNASYIDGVPSYFVIKDEKDTRNGEYHFSSSTSPCPINPKLWFYLIKKISENY